MSCTYELRETLLTLSGLSLRLGERTVLSDVCARVRNVRRPGVLQGQVVAVLGPSGVGKTQLLRLISGLSLPDSGQVLVGPEQTPVSRGRVGVVAQQYPLFEHRTVLGNLIVAARHAGLSRAESASKSQQLLSRFGLEGHASSYPCTLSGGQRQRAAIAQQLIRPKPLLVMDEPFSGLDPRLISDVCRLISELTTRDEELTILLVTHDISAALAVSDTLWLLGRVRDERGAPQGARIVHSVDLMERGLAWHPDVTACPEFERTKREVEARFAEL